MPSFDRFIVGHGILLAHRTWFHLAGIKRAHRCVLENYGTVTWRDFYARSSIHTVISSYRITYRDAIIFSLQNLDFLASENWTEIFYHVSCYYIILNYLILYYIILNCNESTDKDWLKLNIRYDVKSDLKFKLTSSNSPLRLDL